MSLKKRLIKKQQEKKARWDTIELDYALSWVLAAIGQEPASKEQLIFKGGTCLKKCYFGERYRFSQDLDFTALSTLSDRFLDQSIQKITDIASELSNQVGDEIKYSVELYQEKEPHPFHQRAYLLRAQYPWHRTPLTKIKVEVSRDETLAFPIQERGILHEYGESILQKINTYSLEEILAEKFRGILQNQAKFKVKGWVRSRVRDFYDLWHILNDFKGSLNLQGFEEAFVQKCLAKNLHFKNYQQFFNQAEYLLEVKRDWEQHLQGLVNELPDFEKTIQALEKLSADIFKGKQCQERE